MKRKQRSTVDKLKQDILSEPFQFDYSYIEKFNQWFTEKMEYNDRLEKLKNNAVFQKQLEELKARKKIAIEQTERRFDSQFEKLLAEHL